MIEFIQTMVALHPEIVRAWAALVVLDVTLFVLASLLPDGEEQGIESASAVGVVDDLRMEVGRG